MDPQNEIRKLTMQLQLAHNAIESRDKELEIMRRALDEEHVGAKPIRDERDDYIAMLEGRLNEQGRKLQMLERCLGSIREMSTEALGEGNGRMGDEVRVPMFDARVPMFQTAGLMDKAAQMEADAALARSLHESDVRALKDHGLAKELSDQFKVTGLHESDGAVVKVGTGPSVIPSFVMGAAVASMIPQERAKRCPSYMNPADMCRYNGDQD